MATNQIPKWKYKEYYAAETLKSIKYEYKEWDKGIKFKATKKGLSKDLVSYRALHAKAPAKLIVNDHLKTNIYENAYQALCHSCITTMIVQYKNIYRVYGVMPHCWENEMIVLMGEMLGQTKDGVKRHIAKEFVKYSLKLSVNVLIKQEKKQLKKYKQILQKIENGEQGEELIDEEELKKYMLNLNEYIIKQILNNIYSEDIETALSVLKGKPADIINSWLKILLLKTAFILEIKGTLNNETKTMTGKYTIIEPTTNELKEIKFSVKYQEPSKQIKNKFRNLR